MKTNTDNIIQNDFWLQNSGQIAPLDEIINLKEKYRFRLLMDESNSFGALGGSGRGLTEFYGVPVCTCDLKFYLFLSKFYFTWTGVFMLELSTTQNVDSSMALFCENLVFFPQKEVSKTQKFHIYV